MNENESTYLPPDLEQAAYEFLSTIAGIETHEINLRDHKDAWTAIEAFSAKVRDAARTDASRCWTWGRDQSEVARLYEALNCLWASGRQVMHDLPASGWKCGFEASMDFALKTLNNTKPLRGQQP